LKDSLRQSYFFDDFLKVWIGTKGIEHWPNFEHNDAVCPVFVRSPHLLSVLFDIAEPKVEHRKMKWRCVDLLGNFLKLLKHAFCILDLSDSCINSSTQSQRGRIGRRESRHFDPHHGICKIALAQR